MDNFYEQLLTTKKTIEYKMANIFMYVLFVFAVLSFSNIIFAVIFAGLAVGLFFLKKNLYVEYEYVFTNGTFDVDKILEMKKRKSVMSFDIKNVELLALEDSIYVKDFGNKPSKIVDYVPKTYEGKKYIAMLTGGNERIQIRLGLNEKMLNLCFKYNPRAVKKN